MRLARFARPLSRVLVAGAMCLVGTAALAQGTVTGRVTAQGTNEPLSDARVLALGTNAAATTSQDGKYTMNGVRAGTIEVQVLRVGYTALKKTVTVTAGGTVSLDFEMQVAVIKLQDVVTTATGQARKVELGNAISTLGDVSTKVEQTSITSLGDLMVAKAPGVAVLEGSFTGQAPVIRIRGLNSISLTNAPIFIIDGVRMISGNGGNTGPEAVPTTSYLNDLDPSTIEDIEIVKGPSAATLYGTDAANGVIVITTKKGRAGASKWTWTAEDGTLDDRNKYLSSYAIFGHNPNAPSTAIRCILPNIAAGTCTQDSTSQLNIMKTDSLTGLGYGHRQLYSAQVSGGTDAIRYFTSGTINNERGPYHMPFFSQQRLVSLGTPILPQWLDPETQQRTNLQANISANVSPNFDLNLTTSFGLLNERFPETDNNFSGLIYNAYQGPGFSHAGPGYTNVGSLGETLHGYASYVPSEINQQEDNQQTQRFTGTAAGNWRPFQWMQNSANVGVDLADNLATSLCRFQQCINLSTIRLGSASSASLDSRNFSAKIVSTSTWQIRPWANLKTTFGADYTNSEQDGSTASGTVLPPGGVTVGNTTNKNASNTLQTATKTLGGYVQEQLALRDRLFLIVAMREDENTAFGTNVGSVAYPKASLSWQVSDESFFPKYNWLNSLRLRTAWGESGVEPGATAALASYGATSVSVASPAGVGTDVPGLIQNALALPSLKPETSAETEAGFEMRAINNRVNLDVTYYSKESAHALINVPIAASAASPVSQQLQNLGSIKNAGIEATLTTQLADTRRFGWDVTVSGSHNSNKVVNLGTLPNGSARLTTGLTGTTRDTTGFPLDAFFFQEYTYTNPGAGTPLQLSNLSTVNSATPFTYNGYEQPRDLVSVQNGFDLLSRKLRINILLDYKGGSSLVNQPLDFQCVNGLSCGNLANTAATLKQQAAGIMFRLAPTPTAWGFLENNQFWRLRELSATYTLPDRVASTFARAHDAQISFAGRNLWVWTKYSGSDPEESAAAGDIQTNTFASGPRTYFTGRIVLHY